jgi:hypothetical protein
MKRRRLPIRLGAPLKLIVIIKVLEEWEAEG